MLDDRSKMRELSYAQEVALVDAVEQWWRSVAQGGQEEPASAPQDARTTQDTD